MGTHSCFELQNDPAGQLLWLRQAMGDEVEPQAPTASTANAEITRAAGAQRRIPVEVNRRSRSKGCEGGWRIV